MLAITDWFTYVNDNLEYIWEALLAHLRITLIAVGLATVYSVLMGVFIQRRPIARSLVLSTTAIFLTIPSLALFAVFIPLVGTGNTPAIIALFLYAQLPIMRNTVTGLDAVSPAIVESARGMGMTRREQLFRVKLPLAWPVIMTGIRVATLMAVGIAAIATLVGGESLGDFIQAGLTRLGLPRSEESVWTGVIFTVLLGLALDAVLATVQRFTTPRGLRV